MRRKTLRLNLRSILIGLIGAIILNIILNRYLPPKYVDLSVTNDTNIFRIAEAIEKCNGLKGTVKDITKTHLVLSDDKYPDILLVGYLSDSDMAKLDIGDTVYLKGDVRYIGETNEYEFYKHSVFIGNAIEYSFLLQYAKIYKLEKGTAGTGEFQKYRGSNSNLILLRK